MTHLKALYSESSRIFPQASLSFILPFKGITGLSEFTKDLATALKLHCPQMWRCRPSSMVNKMTGGGVHINAEGKRSYTDYLMRVFTKCSPQIQSQPRPQPHNRGVNAARSGRKPAGGKENFRVRGPPRASGPPRESQVPPPPPPQIPSSIPSNPAASQQCPPAQAGHPSSMVHELAEALTHMMMMHRRGPQLQTTQRPWYY